MPIFIPVNITEDAVKSVANFFQGVLARGYGLVSTTGVDFKTRVR